MKFIQIILFILFIFSLSLKTNAATYTVDNIADTDDGLGYTLGDLTNTLRKCIRLANGNAGADVINFNLGAGGPFTISLTTALPNLTDNSGVTIDGWDNSGNDGTPNTVAVFDATTSNPMNASYMIVLGNGANISPGLRLASNNNVIKGLVLQDFGDGTPSATDRAVYISGNSNQVLGCYIGMDITGTIKGTKTVVGVYITGNNNSIGDGTEAGANLISGMNTNGVGIEISGAGANANNIKGNIVGLQSDGSTEISGDSQLYGIRITSSSTGNNTIGGSVLGEGNVISGNTSYGVFIQNTSVTGNSILGNIIGPQANGSNYVTSNSQDIGIYIDDSRNNIIGGNTTNRRNIISANEDWGIYIYGSTSTGNIIQGNYIGINKNGTGIINDAVQDIGVYIIQTANSNTIGGTNPGEENVISCNITSGIYTTSNSGSGNTIIGNIIGLQADGETYITSNTQITGISIWSSHANIIGGANINDRNIISGNETRGIFFSGGTNNIIKGNYIGPSTSLSSITGSSQDYGIYFSANATDNDIGGAGANEPNVIAYNTTQGLYLTGAATDGNIITRNPIYSNGGKPIELNYPGTGGNIEKAPPTIVSWSSTQIDGTSLANDVIEIFKNTTGSNNDATEFLGTTTADGSGDWSFTVPRSMRTLDPGDYILANATDASNNTSEFSNARLVTLPIELLNFDAICKENSIIINWTTATETNNDFFTIERTSDGINNKTEFIIVGSGNSTQTKHYSFVDDKPLQGISYYRLKQTDFDGKYEYFDFVSVSCEELMFSEMVIYPNPGVGEYFNLNIPESKDVDVLVVVYDVTGKEYYSKIIMDSSSGNNYIIDMENKLAPGIYFVTASNNKKIYKSKMIVQ